MLYFALSLPLPLFLLLFMIPLASEIFRSNVQPLLIPSLFSLSPFGFVPTTFPSLGLFERKRRLYLDSAEPMAGILVLGVMDKEVVEVLIGGVWLEGWWLKGVVGCEAEVKGGDGEEGDSIEEVRERDEDDEEVVRLDVSAPEEVKSWWWGPRASEVWARLKFGTSGGEEE